MFFLHISQSRWDKVWRVRCADRTCAVPERGLCEAGEQRSICGRRLVHQHVCVTSRQPVHVPSAHWPGSNLNNKQ